MNAGTWDKEALELAGVGAIVMIYRDLHDTLDREHEPTVRRWLTWGGLLSPDGENLTERGEEARRAALRLLAERQVSPERIEALAPGRDGHAAMLGTMGIALVGLRHAVAHHDADDMCLSNVEAGLRDLGLDPDALVHDVLRVPSPDQMPAPDGLTTEARERVGYVAALVQASSYTCITGRPEDAARAFGGLLGAAGESEDGRRGAARALRHLAAVLDGQPVPVTTAEQDADALRREAKKESGINDRAGRVYAAGIRRALDVLAPHLPPPRGAR